MRLNTLFKLIEFSLTVQGIYHKLMCVGFQPQNLLITQGQQVSTSILNEEEDFTNLSNNNSEASFTLDNSKKKKKKSKCFPPTPTQDIESPEEVSGRICRQWEH